MQQFHLNHSQFPGQEQAISEIIALALQVTKHQRGEDHLQLSDIRFKLLREVAEFTEAENFYEQASEIADIVYCSVQEYTHTGDESLLHRVVSHFCQKIPLTEEESYKVALAKYSKNFETEYEAIRKALDLDI